jgi:hypothetical protein
VSGRAENSIRVNGTPESRISGVTFENVNVTFDRWTTYPGAVFDNRPTTAYPDIEKHDTPGISVRYADHVAIRNCAVTWGQNRPEYFTRALEAEHVSDLQIAHFTGDDVVIR